MRSTQVLIDELVWALEFRPGDFSATEHVLTDRLSGQGWWLGNGRNFFSLYYPFKMSVGYWERRRAWEALRCWQAHLLREANAGKPSAAALRKLEMAV